jgi:hypothetical protein
MANFETHLAVASLSSGVFAITSLAAGLATPAETTSYFLLGVMGGLLPDIDANQSVPVKIFFNLLALNLAFAAMFGLAGRFSVAELFIIWLGVYLLVRFMVYEAFTRLTVHRGILHSLLAAIFFGALTVDIAHHLLDKPTEIAWLSGFAVLLGYIVHLILDELFSVDLLNNTVKRSFGTALKPLSLSNWPTSLLLGALTLALVAILPDTDVIWRRVSDPHTYMHLRAMLLPHGPWFAQLMPR